MEIKVKPRTGIKVRLEDGSGFVDEKARACRRRPIICAALRMAI